MIDRDFENRYYLHILFKLIYFYQTESAYLVVGKDWMKHMDFDNLTMVVVVDHLVGIPRTDLIVANKDFVDNYYLLKIDTIFKQILDFVFFILSNLEVVEVGFLH